MADSEQPDLKRSLVDRIPTSLIVLLTVAFLLQGPFGTLNVLWTYTKSLLTALLGGEDLFVEVVCQTAPLTLSAAAIAFAVRCRMLTFRSLTGLVTCSAILLGATWLGGQLRTLMAPPVASSTPLAPSVLTNHSIGPIVPASNRIPVLEASFRIADPDLLTDLTMMDGIGNASEVISIHEAADRLCDFSSSTAGPKRDWRDTIPRVGLLPEAGSLVGVIARGINQTLGYLVYYRPRLFLAAILLGTYIGWCWQPMFGAFFARKTEPSLPA